MRGLMILVVTLGLVACKRASDDNPKPSTGSQGVASTGSGAAPAKPRGPQVSPPVDLKTPPADAVKTASGLIYKKLVSNETGAKPGRNDVVLVNYTGWRQATGETFFSNRGRGQPLPLNLSQSAPGFVEALPLLRIGEKAALWLPPSIGYKSPPTTGSPETLVYEIEVVDITPAPPIPDNVDKPPGNAQTLKSGTRMVVVRPGTGKDKARPFDTVTFNYTAWDGNGRMIDTTELRKRPVTAPPYKQSVAMGEMLTTMTAGQRVRFWVDAEKMINGGKPVGGVSQGLLCYELEVLQIAKAAHEPPLAPPDVAKPPAGVKRTEKGVSYRLLKAGGSKDGKHPTAADSVKVHYTGWTTDGQMFDSSELRGEPATFALTGVVAGWTDGIPVMTVGDRVRFWIPEELAYKGVPGKPAGMLVFDVELLEINPPAAKAPHGAH
jgi:FKBP-type peptidyl-prolyl cis-trans isomerase